MNRLSIASLFLLSSVSGAFAHSGHVAMEGGHTHWIAIAAAVVAVAIGVGGLAWRFSKQRRANV